METPCVNICEIDRDAKICIGCGRTGEEISRWIGMTDAERRDIMSTLDARLEKLPRRAGDERARAAMTDRDRHG